MENLKMRKSREEAAETRERIVDTAAHEFGQHGIAETGLADVMAAVGLTHGGFYKHFESKGQRGAKATEKSMDSKRLSREKAKGDEALEAMGRAYFSSTPRNNTEEVCPVLDSFDIVEGLVIKGGTPVKVPPLITRPSMMSKLSNTG